MQGHAGACAAPQISDFSAAMPQVAGSLELKTQFCTREGEYRLIPQSEAGRANRVAYSNQGNNPVKVSFYQERICYNLGRELFIFPYKGVMKPVDPSKAVDKKVYKGSFPTCHDFNQVASASVSSSPSSSTLRTATPTAAQETTETENSKGSQEEIDRVVSTPSSEDTEDATVIPWEGSARLHSECSLSDECGQSLQLLVGFSAGQIQIVDPLAKDYSGTKFFNDERLIDRTKVTCLAWVPFSTQLFLASHTSGQMYLYKSDCISSPQAPHYQVFKTGQGYTIYTCRSKQTRNPLFRWVVGEGSLNNFAFSPGEGKYLATVSQDGVMRCFEYARMELTGSFRSYFGGLLCVAWSPDAKYVLCGGEDDLITLWSVSEKRVVARGQGHNSWVNCVQFDPYLCCDGGYRFGSVGQDTQLCLWDVNESEMLKQPKPKKLSSLSQAKVTSNGGMASGREAATLPSHPDQNRKSHQNNITGPAVRHKENNNNSSSSSSTGTGIGIGTSNSNSSNNHKDKEQCNGASSGPIPIQLGCTQCPRLNQVPMLEPLICKRIAPERLTALHFREDSIVTACQEGYVFTWLRPGARLETTGERADFGTSVAAAFIDIDVPSTTNSTTNNCSSTLTSSGAATTTTT